MAKGKKTGGRDFQPGAKPGPGRPRAPEDEKLAFASVKASRSRIRFDWQQFYEELVELSQSELQSLVGSKDVPPAPDVPVLKLLVARALLYAMRTGRAFELQVHKDLMCGPDPKQVELSGPGGEPLSPMANYSEAQLARAHAALDKAIKEAECSSTQNSQQSSESQAPCLPPGSDTA
jgi:hypothetical protein